MATQDSYQMKLAFVAECITCERMRAVVGAGLCPECGNPLTAEHVKLVRAAIRARRNAFKVALHRLGERVAALGDALCEFRTDGVPLSAQEHLDQVIRLAMAELIDRNSRVKALLEAHVWDPEESGTIEAFGELIRELDSALVSVTEQRDTMPPVEWRAVHRATVRASMAMVRGQAAMAAVIAAPDLNAAMALVADAERWFAEGARHRERISALIKVIQDSLADGPIRQDGSLDVALAAWSSVGQSVTSIADAAALVRRAFAEVPGVSDAADHYIVGFLPVLATSARAVDHELMVARASHFRSLLDAADACGAWITDHALLVDRVWSALDRIHDESDRIGSHWRYGLPRRQVMRTMTEAYRELVEGALRDLGSVVLIAARAVRQEPDGAYEGAVVEGVKAGEIANEFVRQGPPCTDGIRMLLRNASAHASVTISDTGVIATQREIRDGRATTTSVTFTDEQFAEQLVALLELLLALQLALFPWATGHSDQNLAAAVAAAVPSRLQRDQTLDLLAGLAGLTDTAVTFQDGHMTISASERGARSALAENKVLSLVPAAFGTLPTPARVTLSLHGRQPVTFTPDEFGYDEASEQPHTPALLGLVTAKWLLESSGELSPWEEATYVTALLADTHAHCAALAPSDRESALRSLERIRGRVDVVLAEGRRSALTEATVVQIDSMIVFLRSVATTARATHGHGELRLLAERAAASVETAGQIGGRAREIRDRP
jgi:hypothetical protein